MMSDIPYEFSISMTPNPVEADTDLTIALKVVAQMLVISALHNNMSVPDVRITLNPEGELAFNVLGADSNLISDAILTMEAE